MTQHFLGPRLGLRLTSRPQIVRGLAIGAAVGTAGVLCGAAHHHLKHISAVNGESKENKRQG